MHFAFFVFGLFPNLMTHEVFLIDEFPWHFSRPIKEQLDSDNKKRMQNWSMIFRIDVFSFSSFYSKI